MTRGLGRSVMVLALLGALAGCGPTAGGEPPPPQASGPPPVAERFIPGVPEELRVRDPKDARGIAPCDLLTPSQLVDLGFQPDTAREDGTLRGRVCSWQLVDGSTTGGAGLITDPDANKLPDIYLVRGTFARFEILQIAGHPAVRADDIPVGECSLSIAVADEQIVVVDGYADGRVLPDPCATARRMAELILSNLPPLR